MLISHEVPIALLEKSREFNDYDYALVHLFEHEAYFNFYRESLRMGRKVILDNSLFELGKSFESEKFYSEILRLIGGLGKDIDLEYIIPDVWMDSDKTISSIDGWINGNYCDELSHLTSIGVIQGDTNESLTECLLNIKSKVDRVAISFGYDHWGKDDIATKNRTIFINNNLNILKNIDIHLLGCWLPYEFSSYKHDKYSFIKTIDTSSPILHGINGNRYDWYGILKKDIDKIDNHMFDYIENMDDILFNIKLFRNMCNNTNMALSGVQSSGKTTILNKFGTEWNKVYEIMKTIEKTHNINESGDDSTQVLVMNTHKNKIIESMTQSKNTIFDRCILDGFVYTTYLFNKNKISNKCFQYAKNMFLENINFYDVIFYIMPELGIIDDGTRSTNQEFYDEIIAIFEDIIKISNIDVIRLSGSVEDRLNTINAKCSVL